MIPTAAPQNSILESILVAVSPRKTQTQTPADSKNSHMGTKQHTNSTQEAQRQHDGRSGINRTDTHFDPAAWVVSLFAPTKNEDSEHMDRHVPSHSDEGRAILPTTAAPYYDKHQYKTVYFDQYKTVYFDQYKTVYFDQYKTVYFARNVSADGTTKVERKVRMSAHGKAVNLLREAEAAVPLQYVVCMYVCIYVYVYMHVCENGLSSRVYST